MKTKLSARRRGQGLVEFIMVFPLLMLLLLGVYEFGRAWNIYQVMTDAAREGARTAAVFSNPAIGADSVYAVVNSALARVRIDTAAATKTMTGYDIRPGSVTMQIQYAHEFRLIDGLLSWTTGQSTFQMSTTSTFRNE